MVGRGAVLGKGGTVLACGVAGVAVPAVVGELAVQGMHVVVAVGFGQDGGGRYREILAVALHHRGVGHVAPGTETVAVDDDETGAHLQRVKGTVHGQDGSLQNVDAVNLLGRHAGHGPGQGIALNVGTQGIAARG